MGDNLLTAFKVKNGRNLCCVQWGTLHGIKGHQLFSTQFYGTGILITGYKLCGLTFSTLDSQWMAKSKTAQMSN